MRKQTNSRPGDSDILDLGSEDSAEEAIFKQQQRQVEQMSRMRFPSKNGEPGGKELIDNSKPMTAGDGGEVKNDQN